MSKSAAGHAMPDVAAEVTILGGNPSTSMWLESHYPLWTRPILAASKRHARQFAGR